MSDYQAAQGAQVHRIKQSLGQRHEGETIRYTTCYQNGCWDAVCPLKVHIKDGKVVGIEPDDSINPSATREELSEQALRQGMVQSRACPMGHAWRQELYAPTRITHPLKRVGKRGEGKFERISWEEALDEIAGQIKGVLERRGPHSIWHTHYSGFGVSSFPFAPWLGKDEQSVGVSSWGAHSCEGTQPAEKFWLGYEMEGAFIFGTHDKLTGFEAPDLFNSNLVVLWGWNPLIHWFGAVPYYLKLARERGIPVICIDPRYSPSAEVLADQWIPIRPGTDLAMMLAIAQVLFAEDLYDKEYVAQWVEPQGFQKWRAYVMGDEDGEAKTPEWAEEKCGVPAETIREFARLYARSKPVHLQFHYAPAKIHRGEYAAGAAMLLQTMTGNLTIPGGCESGACLGTFPHLGMPFVDFQKAPPEYPFLPVVRTSMWAEAILQRPRLDSGEITVEEYNRLIANPAENPPPNIGMMVFENNYLNNIFDTNKRIKAVKALDFTWGFLWHTNQPTARYMDIILPAPVTFLETWDSPLPLLVPNRFMASPSGMHNWFMLAQKCVEPPDEVRSKDWAWTQLAKRLGIAEKFNPRLKDVELEDWDTAVEGIYREAYENWAAETGSYLNPPDWETFNQKPIIRVPIDKPFHAFQNTMAKGESPFMTPSGQAEFYSSYVTNQDMTKSKYGGRFDPMPVWEPSYMPGPAYNSFYDPKAKDFPLYMLTPVSTYRQHSSNYNNPWLRGDCYRQSCWLSVVDANSRGIKDGDRVRVFSNVGEMILPAYVTSRMSPGVVAVHHGGWYTPSATKTALNPDGIDLGGAPNLLIEDKHSPHGVGNLLIAGLVQVERFDGGN